MAATITQQILKHETGVVYGSIKVVMLTADVIAAFVTPITILPACGVGRIIQVLDTPIYKLSFSGAAFATNTTLDLLINGATLGTNELFNVDFSQGANTYLEMTKNVISVGSQFIENAALVLQVETGAPTGGGASSITLYINYKIVTL